MISLPSQPATTQTRSRAPKTHKGQSWLEFREDPTAGFNPKGSHWRASSFFVCGLKLGPQLIGFLLEPFWEILLERRLYINQKLIGNGPCFLKFFKGPLRNELSQLFVLPIQIASSKYRTWVQIRYILQGFDGLCLVHHIENPPKPSRTCSLLWITCI